MNFNRPIEILNVPITKNEYGENVPGTPTVLVKIGSNIMQLNQNEAIAMGGDETNTVMMKFEVRRTTETFGINRSHQLRTLEDDTTWFIENVDHHSLRHKKKIIIYAHRFE